MRAISYKTVTVTYSQLIHFANAGFQAITAARYADPRTSVAVAVIRQRTTPLLDKYSRKHREAVLEIPEGMKGKEAALLRDENTRRLEALLQSVVKVRNFPDLKLSDLLGIVTAKAADADAEETDSWGASQFSGEEIASLVPFFTNDVFTLPTSEEDEDDEEVGILIQTTGLDFSEED